LIYRYSRIQWTLRGDLEQQGSTSGESRGRSPDAETDAAFENEIEIEIDIGARLMGPNFMDRRRARAVVQTWA